MRLPSKVTPYKMSVVAKFPVVLKALRNGATTPIDLYLSLRTNFSSAGDFIMTLDCLYALGAIEYDERSGVMRYAG